MYATRSDITDAYGDDVLYGAADEDGHIVDARITRALETATAEIDSYLAARHTLPLPSVPAMLRNACVDIAVYKLNPDADSQTDGIRSRYKDAVAWLTKVSTNKVSLGLPRERSKPSTRPVVAVGSERQFSRSKLRDY